MPTPTVLIATNDYRCYHCFETIAKGVHYLDLGKLCFHQECFPKYENQKVTDAQLEKSLRVIFKQKSVCWILDNVTDFMREQAGLTDSSRYDDGELSDEDEAKEEKIRLVEQCAQDLGDAGGW